MKVSKRVLVAIAGVVWALAGANIAVIGAGAFVGIAGEGASPFAVAALALGAVAVFSAFHGRVFSQLVGKHVARIEAMPDSRVLVFRFFDAKGYLMMAVMMGGGIALRAFGIVPGWFIAFFYAGLGTALVLAGASFLVRAARRAPAPCPALPRTWAHRAR